MPVLERARRLVGGKWKYQTVDESTSGGLPSGGTTGEVLAKQSNADGDVGWDPSGGSQPLGKTFADPVLMEDCAFALVGTQASNIDGWSYDNGPDDDGIGSTLTANDPASLADGAGGIDNLAAVQVGDRLAFADAPNTFFGIFTVTDLGGVSDPWVLTRATDADTPATFCRSWAVRIVGGDLFDGGMLRSLNVEAPGDAQSVGDFSQNGSFMIEGSRRNLAFGSVAVASGGAGAVAVGANSEATGTRAHAFGYSAQSSGAAATALGTGAVATVASSTVIAALKLYLQDLPTDPTGLPSGQVYVDGTILKLAP